MKAITLLLAGLTLTACAAPGSRNLYSGNLAAPAPSLADELPADTLFYVEISDVQKMRTDMATSDLGLMYHDEEMQTFLAGGLEMLTEGWEAIRTQMGEQGIPAELINWDTLESFSAGMAMRARPGLEETPFDAEPELYFLAEVGLQEGKGEMAFGLLSGLLMAQGAQSVDSSEDGELVFADTDGDLRIFRRGDLIRFEGTMGAKGDGVLSSDQEFRRSRLQVQADGAAMFGYFDFEKLMDTLHHGLSGKAPQFAPVIDKLYGDILGKMNGMAFATGWEDKGTYTIAKVDLSDDSQEEGSLFRVMPYDKDLLDYIPSDATAFSISSSDHAAGTQVMLDMLDEVAATEIMEGMPLGQMLQMQSAEAYDWLFGSHRPEMEAAMMAFGDRAFSYTVGNGLQSESLAFMEVKDPVALNAVLDQMMPRMKGIIDEAGQGYVTLKMKRVMRTITVPATAAAPASTTKEPGAAYFYLDIDLSSVLPPQVAGMIQLQPTIGVSDDGWMVFSMARNSVRQVLMNGVPMPEETIRENQDAQDFLSRTPKSSFAVAWGDPRPTIDALAGMALGFAPMIMGPLEQEMDLPFTLDDLPSAALFTRYLRPSETVSYAVHGDLITESYGSFGLADLFTLCATGVNLGGPIAMMGMDQGIGVEPMVEFDDDDDGDEF